MGEKKAAAKSEHMGKLFLGIGIAIAAMDQARNRVYKDYPGRSSESRRCHKCITKEK